MHAPIELVGLVGRNAYDKGAAYARQHRAVVRRHDSFGRVIVGSVEGSGRNVYSTTVYYDLTRNGTVSGFDGECSCPVRQDCKHSVALYITAQEQARTADARKVEIGRWRSQLEDIFPDPATQAYSPLALTFQFAAPDASPSDRDTRFTGWRRASGHLEVRAMRKGKRGQWIATGAAWHEITRAAIPDADPAQLDALAALVRLHQASDQYSYGTPTWLSLDAIRTGALWSVLKDVAASGVHLMESNEHEVTLAHEPARTSVVVGYIGDGGISVMAGLDHPLPLTETMLLGQPAHGVAGRDAHSTLTLVPFEAPATREWLDLHRQGLIQVPATERTLFERTILPRITRQPWRSTGGFAPETTPEPTLVIRVRLLFNAIGSTPRASVECEWRYGEQTDPFALTYTLPADPRNTGRDADAERALLDAAGEAMQPLPSLRAATGHPLEEMVVTGHAVVVLTEEVLPALEAIDGVELDLPDDALPEFHDLGEPEIAIDVVATNRDWFDLEVRLTLSDRDVPIGHVITALASGDTTLWLEDGGYLSLDRPELDQLRQLLEEGRALQDQRRSGLRVNRLNLSWWEELQALGVIDQQVNEWLDRLRAATTEGDPPPLPGGLTATLRPYQVAGYEWLTRLRRNGLGGVLADDMGLGKTIQTLAMILDWKREKELADRADDGEAASASASPPAGVAQANGAASAASATSAVGATGATSAAAEPAGPWLVVAPTSVVPNWATEAARFTPDVRVAVVSQTSQKRGTSLAEVAEGADVVVTSYALFRLDHSEYEALEPTGLVLDEAQNVKNRTSRAFALAKSLPAQVKFAITGTPMENNLTELWAMFAITAPGLLGTPQQFHELYAAPIERGNGAELGLFSRLRRRIAPFLLRRTKEEVTPDLPEKSEQVLTVELEPAHRKIYDRHLARERQRVMGLVADLDRNRVEVLSALTRLRQLAIDASLVDADYDGVPSSKLEVLIPLLREAAQEGHRVLVFSQFTRYLGMIAARLREEGIAYSYLDGATTKRAQVIQGFADGRQPVFLISLKAGGVGLNLAMADYCVLADPWWNPAAEAQAVDRAHRIGQTRPVLVYRLVASDTIEEKVMALQDSKRALVAGVLGAAADDGEAGLEGSGGGSAVAGSGRLGRLSAEEVRDLLG